MPIIVTLKEPAITLVVGGDIKDTPEDIKKWDEIFNNGVLIVKGTDRNKDNNILIPLWRECNVAFMQEISNKDLAEQRKKAEEERKQGRRGPTITSPEFIIPGGRGGRGGN